VKQWRRHAESNWCPSENNLARRTTVGFPTPELRQGQLMLCPREVKTNRRVQSAGAQSALGKEPAKERVFRPTLRHLADRIATRLRAKSRPGRTVTVRVRFGDLRSVTRSVTLEAPISATAILAEIAEQLVRAVLADYPNERTSSLLVSVSHLEEHAYLQLSAWA
jgi:DNA polymerase-4